MSDEFLNRLDQQRTKLKVRQQKLRTKTLVQRAVVFLLLVAVMFIVSTEVYRFSMTKEKVLIAAKIEQEISTKESKLIETVKQEIAAQLDRQLPLVIKNVTAAATSRIDEQTAHAEQRLRDAISKDIRKGLDSLRIDDRIDKAVKDAVDKRVKPMIDDRLKTSAPDDKLDSRMKRLEQELVRIHEENLILRSYLFPNGQGQSQGQAQ